MVTRRTLLGSFGLGALGLTMLPDLGHAADRELEPEFLDEQLRARSLPPLSERLPKRPRIVGLKAMGRTPGRYGGTVRTIIGSGKDVRLMTIYGYARLVGYDEHLVFQPDILEAFQSENDTVFTFTIRDGHKWSDGSPLTTDDFRYWWEDVLLNKDLTPGGGSLDLRVDGNLPRFEVLDALTVRYSWERPNPNFLPSLAGPQPLIIVGPSAYLKQFHKKYQDEFRLAALMKENRVKKWADLHIKMSREYRPENPDLPTLYPWRNTTAPPAEQFIFERNPYFHRVDENGRQLPYIDRFILNVSSSSIIPAKTGAGESDLQANGIDFTDYTFLKDAEDRYPVKVDLWKVTRGSRVAILPNLNCGDEVWRTLFRDVRVRRALSLAIDRHEINMAVFYGLGTASADTVLPESPLYKPEYANAWIDHDPEKANQLLDEVGLHNRNDDGFRLLPDGRPAEITIETPGRKHARHGCAGAGHRSLAQDRHCAVHPYLATRYFPQPRPGWPHHDVHLVRDRERCSDCRHEPPATGTDVGRSVAMASLGNALSIAWTEWSGAGSSRSDGIGQAAKQLARICEYARADSDLAEDALHFH